MKIKVRDIRRLIREALEEAEEAAAEASQWTELPDASFDVKIDNFLVEAEAADENAAQMGEAFDVYEADDEEPAAPSTDAEGEQDPESKLPANQPEEKIDAGAFSREVARLVDNFENLIDVKGVILRRAMNYVGQKYGKDQADTVKDVLASQFGLHLTDEEEEAPMAPPADRAGPGLAG